MKLYPISAWELRKQLIILIVIIFIPLSLTLLLTGYRQHQLKLLETENNVKRLISLFVEEQLNIVSQTYQFLEVLSHVPAVRDIDLEQCNYFLKTVHKGNPQYSTIIVADSNGIIDCCAIPIKKSINVTDRSWFQRIRESRQFVVDQFLVSRSADKASLPFAYPILDSEGNFKAAVGSAYDLEYYKELFDKIPLPADSSIIITDREKKLIYQSVEEKSHLGRSIVETYGFDIPDSGKGRFEIPEDNGKNRLYWFEWLWVGQKSNQICLLVGISKQVMFANVKKALTTNIAALTSVAVIFIMTAWFWGKKMILDPVTFLVRKTENAKRGELEDIKYRRYLPGELHILSGALDSMISDIDLREHERDQAISEMEKELGERKKAESELREREERLKILFEQAADAIYVTKTDGYLVKVNKAACKTTGYTEDEMMHLNVTDIDTVISTDKAFSDFMHSLEPGKPVNIESMQRRKDGSTFPVEITAALLETPDGSRIMGIARDITGRIKLENRIKQTQKLESLGSLASGIAHDFNNILSPIVGISEMLLEDIPAEDHKSEQIRKIYKAGIRGSDLVKQILTFSRQSEHKKVAVKLQTVLQEVLKLVRSTIPADIDVVRDIQSDCGHVLADPTRIHQIVMNLVTNAYHAMNQRSGTIFIKLKETSLDSGDASLFTVKNGRYAMLTVADTGVGIEPEIIDRIFDPYFTTKEPGKGTGLGLATVYGIVREHQGDIKVYSEPGKGSSFNIYLPLIESQVESEQEKKIKTLPRGNERILLVDDEEIIALLQKEMLERLGYKVTEKLSSIEALSTFMENPGAFDMIITDMAMPKMTGEQLAGKVMSINPDIPIIICTGFSEKIDRETTVVSGIKAFIMKPVVKSELALTVRRVLDEKPA